MDLSETLVFIVPLRPKRGANEWHAVQQALQETLRSVKGSTRQDFLVVIAGHEEPDLGAAGDPRITFLRVPFDVPTSPKEGSRGHAEKAPLRGCVATTDKRIKTALFMFLDADDWISNRLVAYILATKGNRTALSWRAAISLIAVSANCNSLGRILTVVAVLRSS